MCKQARLAASEIDKLGPLPDPTPGNDSHYKSFDEVFKNHNIRTHAEDILQLSTISSVPISLQKIIRDTFQCKVRPSSKKAPGKTTISFRATVQHVYATQTIFMLQCDECSL